MREHARHTLIVGIGNSLAGDDAVGLEAARRLSELPLPEGVQVVAAESPGMNLVDLLAGAERAILLDSVVTPGRPGAIRRIALDELEVRSGAISVHDLTAAEALRLAQLAEPERLPKEVVIVAMAISRPASCSVGMSKEASAAMPKLIEAAVEELRRSAVAGDESSCTKSV